MDFFEVIKKRKAIRKYLPNRVIPQRVIRKILETTILAPSARNLQSYKIFVAQSRQSRQRIAQACYNQRSDFIGNASLILIFCTDSKQAEENFGERGKFLYAIQDAAIAASFAMLSCTALGYGSCWIGNFREKEVQNILKTKLSPVAILVVGYSDEQPIRKPRKSINQLAEFI